MKKNILLVFIILSALFLTFSLPTEGQEEGVSNLFTRQADSIVSISTVGKKANRTGTGFIVTSDGYIVTNNHLIKKAKKIFVKLRNKQTYRHVSIIKSDANKDIALIKIDAKGLKAVTLGNSNNVQIGQRVVAIGNPLGLENTISDGLISALRSVNDQLELLQISVPLSQGSSGGPLFNLKGEVIGITTASLSQGQSLNFAVPINYAKPLLSGIRVSKKSQDTATKKQSAAVSAKKDAVAKASLEKPGSVYVVKPSDTLYSLARKFKTTVLEIMKLNKMKTANIYVGQKIIIPSGATVQ